MSFLYNAFYALNPFRTDVSYRQEEHQELPALPDLTQLYSHHSFLGSRKHAFDPRFPRNNADRYKKCFLNFSVWRKCLEEHSEDMDEEDPNALICRRYQQLAINTCPVLDFNNMKEAAEKDSFISMAGLQINKEGTNPSILWIDEHHKITRVERQGNADKHKYKVGEYLHH
jgi:hypothetical protein